MNESTSRLLEAVDALTLPQVEHHKQVDDEGRYLKTHTVEHAPLLEQLRAAITPSSNTAAGSASLASARNIIDAQALGLHLTIRAEIARWGVVGLDPAPSLRRWFILFTEHEREAELIDYRVRELRRWAGQIRNLLDPPRRVEITAPCPVCKSATYTTEAGEVLRHPVVLEYRASDDGRVVSPRAVCRSVDCGAVWESFDAIEELAQELGEKVDANV